MRWTRALSAVAVAALLTPLALVSPAQGQQDRTLDVAPSVDLLGGQVVTVSGTGWTPGAVFGFCQTVPLDPGDPVSTEICGNQWSPGSIGPSGTFSHQVRPFRYLYIPLHDEWVDCTAPADGCVMGAAEQDDIEGTATSSGPLVFASPPPPPAQRGTISLAPDSGLAPGDEITIEGSGFRPGAVMHLYQCLPGASHPSDCNRILPGLFVADAAGAFTATRSVDQYVEPPGSASSVDCGSASCVMAATEAVDFAGTVVESPIALAPPKVMPGGASLAEGDAGQTVMEIPVTLSRPSSDTVSTSWETVHLGQGSPIEATPDDDYDAVSGVVAFAPGTTDATIEIPINGDTTYEPDELFLVRFHDPVNAQVGGWWGLGFGVIVADDDAPTIVPGNVQVVEGDSDHVADVPVALTNPASTTITVEWRTEDLAGLPLGATAGDDYATAAGTITFQPGETGHVAPVTIQGDTAAETDELVAVVFHDPVGAPIGGFYGLGFAAILDDD